MNISTDSIQAEDKRRYIAVMQPYLSGERDSSELTIEDKAFVQNSIPARSVFTSTRPAIRLTSY